MPKGKNISDADRKIAPEMLKGTPSERARGKKSLTKFIEGLLSEGGKMSDSDRRLLEEKYLNRNDGGIARKTRTF
jgi:hypothetical protein